MANQIEKLRTEFKKETKEARNLEAEEGLMTKQVSDLKANI